MNRSKQRGTAWETALVALARRTGWPHAERRALAGQQDRGDLAGMPGIVVEAKSCARLELAAWVDEAEVERRNDGADYALVAVKRRGKGDPGDGYGVMRLDDLLRLLRQAGYGTPLDQVAS